MKFTIFMYFYIYPLKKSKHFMGFTIFFRFYFLLLFIFFLILKLEINPISYLCISINFN